MITDPSNIHPGTGTDFTDMRCVKTSVGEHFAGDLEHAIAGGQWAPCWAIRPICFFPAPGWALHNPRRSFPDWRKHPDVATVLVHIVERSSHTNRGFAVAVPTAPEIQKILSFNG
jgi:hypothetical protein